MSRTWRGVSAAVLGAAVLVAGFAEAARAPAPGKWKGNVVRGSKIDFKVKRGRVKQLAAGVRAQCVDRASGEPTRKLEIGVTPDPVKVTGGGFVIKEFDAFFGVSSDVAGEFTKRRRAEGTIRATVRLDATNEECDGTSRWTAKRKRKRR